MSHAIRKRQNLENIEHILWDHPEGLTKSELARRINVDPGTITKYLNSTDLPHVYEDDDGKLKLNRQDNLARMLLDLDEVMILHIAARLLVRQTNQHNPHAASILRKLARVVNQTDEAISEHMGKAADRTDDSQQVRNEEYLKALRTLAEARAKKRKVTLEYELDDGKWIPYTFSPYFIEPYAPGLTTHIIGFREPVGKLRTFKLERLRNVKLSSFAAVPMPESFDPDALLEYAWGIWYTDEPPELVVLKFSPRVKRRVLETRWHRKQAEPEVLKDDYVVWRCLIAEPQEMIYWIRGWGADVEVLEPAWLKEELVKESRKLAKMYGISQTILDPKLQRALLCWGKTGATDDIFHPALFHILDVAYVACALLDKDAPPRFRKILAETLNTDSDSLRQWLPYFIALHDIGKFSAAFQGQNETQKARIKREGFSFQGWSESDFKPHGVVSQVFVEELLAKMQPSLTRNIQRTLSETIGGHHGEYVNRETIKSTKAALARNEPGEWAEIRNVVENFLRQRFLQCELTALPEPLNVSTAVIMLSGFTILCDWLGSDKHFFKPQSDMDWEDYITHSQRCAQDAVQAASLLTATGSTAPTHFELLFPDINEPRPLQMAIDKIYETLLHQPCLAIIEAPTGEGKTEAALALAHRLAQTGFGEDFYYALPTMATSNQMFERLQHHLAERLGISTQAKLVHGQAFLIEDNLRIEPLNNSACKEKDDPRNSALQWFSSKKRALLAPFGVGTIDQAELAALNVRHVALRMIGLAGKVVIIDEVHAYDTYMTTIIEQLLRWLSALNTSVILLSATLPLARRAALAEAYGVALADKSDEHDAYPSLLVLSRGQPPYWDSPAAWQPNRILALERLEFTEEQVEEKARWLLNAIANGGCACWMTNTVKRAQRLFEQLQEITPPDVDLTLLHSQFPLEDRQYWEQDLKAKYGPKGNRPQRGIVVGTQVLEQSLDLDFDLLVSDLAPIDLLLQRAGRLHRHDRPRPSAYEKPCLWINAPSDSGQLALPRADIEIYTEYLLRQTWTILEGSKRITLPTAYRPLIEAVYGAEEPPGDHQLYEAWGKLRKKSNNALEEAAMRLLPEPNPKTPFSYAATQMNFEENENSAASIVAQTRLGEESLNVIPLEVQGETGQLPDGTLVNLNQEAPRELQLSLLRRNLRVSHHDAIHAIKAYNAIPKSLFKESALLKDYYLLPLTNSKGQLATEKDKINFMLHPRLGLVIEKEKQ